MVANKNQLDLLREFIKQHCGIHVGTEKNYLIETRLSSLLEETGSQDFQDFYIKAKSDTTGILRDKIIDAITTHETLWFRDERLWTVMSDVILANFIEDLQSGKKRKIRIWSAACSSGQEPYSIAMLIDEVLSAHPIPGVSPDLFEIIATDISPQVLFLAISGHFTSLEISRGLSPQRKEMYFKQEGNRWTLCEKIRKRVTYKRFNLLDDFNVLGQFDFILCRNVAIYFSELVKRALFPKLETALIPHGYFILGSAESLFGYAEKLEMREYKNSIYYQLRG